MTALICLPEAGGEAEAIIARCQLESRTGAGVADAPHEHDFILTNAKQKSKLF